mgnify:CR=1 FL=1
MRKYSAVSEAFDMFDEETLEALVEQSEIVRYRLQTVPFPLEKFRSQVLQEVSVFILEDQKQWQDI